MLIVFLFSLVSSFTDDAALLHVSLFAQVCVCVRLKGRGGQKEGVVS